MPGVREAIEQKRWKEAEDQIARAAQSLGAETDIINRAAGLLEQLAGAQ